MTEIRCTNCRRPYPEQGVPIAARSAPGCTTMQRSRPTTRPRWTRRSPASGAIAMPSGCRRGAPGAPLAKGIRRWSGGSLWARAWPSSWSSSTPPARIKTGARRCCAAFCAQRGVDAAVEDCSGKRRGVLCRLCRRRRDPGACVCPRCRFRPEARARSKRYGAEMVRIMGPRSNAAQAC